MSESSRPDQQDPPKRWYARVSTWVIGAIVGPVAVSIIVAAILKITGLNDLPPPAHSPPILSISPFQMRSGALKVNVSATGLDDDLSLVFAKPYFLTTTQRALTHNVDNLYQLDRSLIASGAANLNSIVITITITNTSSLPAEIVDARVIDRRWYTPWNGTLVYLPPQGSVFPSKMGFDLDRITPVPENVSGAAMEGPFFGSYDIQLPSGMPTTINVLATTAHHAVSFRLAFEYVIAGKTQILKVGRDPKPFFVSAVDCTDSPGFPYRRIYSVDLRTGILQSMTTGELKVYQSASRSTFCPSHTSKHR